MTVSDAKARQKEVEEQIQKLLDEYEKLAECEIVSISLDRFKAHFNYGNRIHSVALGVILKTVDRGDGMLNPEKRYLYGQWMPA